MIKEIIHSMGLEYPRVYGKHAQHMLAIIITITNVIFIIVAICLECHLCDKCHRYILGISDNFGKLLSNWGFYILPGDLTTLCS